MLIMRNLAKAFFYAVLTVIVIAAAIAAVLGLVFVMYKIGPWSIPAVIFLAIWYGMYVDVENGCLD